MAHALSLAAAGISQPKPNFSKHVYDQLIDHAQSQNLKNSPALYASHVLTRIAYQAVGMADQLPAPLTQTSASTRPIRASRAQGKGKAKLEEEEAEDQSSEEGEEEVDIPEGFEVASSIPETVKRSYRDYEKVKALSEDIQHLKEAYKYVGMKRKVKKTSKIEPRTKANEDRAAARMRQERMAEVQDVLKTEKQLSKVGKSHIQSLLKQQKGGKGKRKEPTDPPAQARGTKKKISLLRLSPWKKIKTKKGLKRKRQCHSPQKRSWW